MGKTKVTDALIQLANRAFSDPQKLYYPDMLGLTRSQLRALERKGIVERVRTVKRTKYMDAPDTVIYAWRLRGYTNATK